LDFKSKGKKQLALFFIYRRRKNNMPVPLGMLFLLLT
jgi:hypothetical protein